MMGLEKKRVLDTKRVFDTQKVLKWFSFDGNRAASRNKNRTFINQHPHSSKEKSRRSILGLE
jgi:hypothetical protein